MARTALLSLLLAAPSALATVYFEETFDDESWTDRWVESKVKDEMGKWELSSGEWYANKEIAQGLKTSEDMRHYGISAKMPTAASSVDKPLIVQFR